MKITLSQDRLTVELKCRTWDLARGLSKSNQESPPDGYRMTLETTSDRSKSGGRATLTMKFSHVSRDVPAFNYDEAYDFFRDDQKTANGGDQTSVVSA